MSDEKIGEAWIVGKASEETYALQGVYEREIKPLATQIIEACEAHDIPCVMLFQVNDRHARYPLRRWLWRGARVLTERMNAIAKWLQAD